jgi:hypothetical protein
MKNHRQQNRSESLFTSKRSCGYKVGIPTHLRDDIGGILRFLYGPLHHRLQRNLGVLASKAHQHVLGHRLCQDSTLHHELATDDLLQPRHLGPGGVKKKEHGANLLCREPRAEGAEAKWH